MRTVRKRESPSAPPARSGRAPGHWIGAALIAATVTTLATEAYLVVADRTVIGARVSRTDQSFLVDGLGQGHRLGQTFVMREDGLDGIRLNAVAQGETDEGEIALALYELPRESATAGDAERLVFQDRVAVDTATRGPTFLFAFPPVAESDGRSYRVDIWMPEPRPAAGIGLWATEGRSSENGSLFINGLSGYAELVFDAQATRATVWSRLQHRFGGAGLTLLLALAAVAHAALFVGLRAIVAGGLAHSPNRERDDRTGAAQ
jgi:hypothetical protein